MLVGRHVGVRGFLLQKLVGGVVAEDFGVCLVGEYRLAFGVDQNALDRSFDEIAVTALALTQRLLDRFAIKRIGFFVNGHRAETPPTFFGNSQFREDN